MKSNIVYVAGEFSFPVGQASTERIRNIAYGFVENGYEVVIIPLMPNYTALGGMYEIISYDSGISYVQHDFKKGSDNDSSTKIGNVSYLDKIKWFINSYSSIITFNKNVERKNIVEPKSIVFLYGRSFVKLKGLFDLFRRANCYVIFDLVEIPESYNGPGGKLNPIFWDWKFASKYIPSRSFGLTAISNFIFDRYKNDNDNITVAPATTSIPEELPSYSVPSNRSVRMLYLGALVDKDAPDYMFEVLSRYCKKYSDLSIELIVAGRYEQTSAGKAWVKYLSEHEILKSRVTLRGELSTEEMEQELSICDAIILLRRNSEIECASFPTRLVEFLRSGRPLISSDFGDVGHYLEHGHDSILLPVDDVESAADALYTTLSNQELMDSMAENGFNKLGKFFDRRNVVESIIDNLKLPQVATV